MDPRIAKAQASCGDNGGTAMRWLIEHRPPVALPTRSWFEEAQDRAFRDQSAAEVLNCLVEHHLVAENGRGELAY